MGKDLGKLSSKQNWTRMQWAWQANFEPCLSEERAKIQFSSSAVRGKNTGNNVTAMLKESPR